MPIDTIINTKDWAQMNVFLRGLSNSEFRRMETYVRTRVLPCLDNDDYWEALYNLLLFRRQAFLAGLVAAEKLAVTDRLDFGSERAVCCLEYIQSLGSDVTSRALNILLPVLRTESQINQLVGALPRLSQRQLLSVLLKVDTPLVNYTVFRVLKRVDYDPELAYRCSLVILKRNTDEAFNFVNIIRTYFGLETLRGQFSMKIEPYELSFLDRDFDTFNNFLNGKRPKI